MNTSRSILRLHEVSKRFGENSRLVTAVVHASVEIREGELVALIGPSGSGKTTLLQIAAGLISPTAGTVELFGTGLSTYNHRALQRVRAERIGFVFQTCRLLDPLNVTDNIALAARFAGAKSAQAKGKALQLLRDIGIEHLARAYPPQLSQGERQRVAAARALINLPDLIFADEPTASLESSQGSR
ncbi:MAG: ATP-binding cassette domain-containing protein, partial [candidate division Zixibacteria bacterium]|nr:ATP-binding cassette domain-containing protein [candidate division Zixibacteria bacterium]